MLRINFNKEFRENRYRDGTQQTQISVAEYPYNTKLPNCEVHPERTTQNKNSFQGWRHHDLYT